MAKTRDKYSEYNVNEARLETAVRLMLQTNANISISAPVQVQCK